MKDVSLVDLLEAGCHFGHKVEKWHPKASSFIYQAREGIHIIDLVKTREQLTKTAEFVGKLGQEGKTLLYVATKRQARGVVREAAERGGIPYLTTRWIGGFLTNWDEVKKNIDKLNKLRQESEDGSWKNLPKHEIVKLHKKIRKLESIYGGVSSLAKRSEVVFIVDIKKEINALKEAGRLQATTLAIVDTNSDPNLVDYLIPANDDAVGSIQLIVNFLTDAYIEGKKLAEKGAQKDKGDKVVVDKDRETGEEAGKEKAKGENMKARAEEKLKDEKKKNTANVKKSKKEVGKKTSSVKKTQKDTKEKKTPRKKRGRPKKI